MFDMAIVKLLFFSLLVCIFNGRLFGVVGASLSPSRLFAVPPCPIRSGGDAASTRRTKPSLALVGPPVMKNLARGSFLKCMADLTGGLPLEVWKSSVVLEEIQSRNDGLQPRSSISIFKSIINYRGIPALWSGLAPRLAEGLFSGGVLLAAKEGLHTLLADYASPMLTNSIGVTLPPSMIGFASGAGGGCAQALVMGPTSLLVTACVKASKEGESISSLQAMKLVVQKGGIRGLYRGAGAVGARQATNWASRQGFTECIRPRIPIAGVAGELLAGCLGGTLSAWNTPFEVARIERQSATNDEIKPLVQTLRDIVKERGIGGLYVGLGPRAAQSCYQTLFLVCVPRLV